MTGTQEEDAPVCEECGCVSKPYCKVLDENGNVDDCQACIVENERFGPIHLDVGGTLEFEYLQEQQEQASTIPLLILLSPSNSILISDETLEPKTPPRTTHRSLSASMRRNHHDKLGRKYKSNPYDFSRVKNIYNTNNNNHLVTINN